MKRLFLCGLAALVLSSGLEADSSQDSTGLLESFLASSVDGKVTLLRRLHTEPTAEASQVYLAALDWAVDHADEGLYDPRAQEIGRLAIESLASVPVSGGVAAVWRYFKNQSADDTRIAALRVIGRNGGALPDGVCAALNDFLSRQNHMSREGGRANSALVGATIDAVARIGDPTSFSVLFEAATHPCYAAGIQLRAASGLSGLDVDVEAELMAMMDSATLAEYRAILEFATGSLPKESRLAIARRVLQYTLNSRYRDLDDAERSRRLRHDAAVVLSRGGGFEPEELAIDYFNAVHADYVRGTVTLAYVIEGVDMVGETGGDVAAVRLTRLLESLNTSVEFERPVDDQLVVATIEELADLGSPVAADALLRTQLLDYPRDIRALARSAETRVRRPAD